MRAGQSVRLHCRVGVDGSRTSATSEKRTQATTCVTAETLLAEASYQDADNEWLTLISFECVGIGSPASHRVMWAAILRHAELPDDERTVAAARARWSGYLRIPARELRAGLQVPML